jgi:hypothetical protein
MTGIAAVEALGNHKGRPDRLFEISHKLTPIFTNVIFTDSDPAFTWGNNSWLFVSIRGYLILKVLKS